MNDVASQITASLAIDLDARTPGRRAIAGFLVQILRSVHLGLETSIALSPVDGSAQMILHLEPTSGGDHRLLRGPRDIVEQVKMRTGRGKWSSSEVASKVFPDLLRAVHVATDQTFRFVTNNGAGLATLQGYIASRGRATGKPHRWGSERLTTAEFEQRLARFAGLDQVTAELRHLLDRLEIRVFDPAAAQDEIDKVLTPLIEPGEHVSDKRHQLIGQLMMLATNGAKLSSADLLALVSPRAHRLLAHIQSLPTLLGHHLQEDARLIGYAGELQVRRALPDVVADLAVLSGESGQGKTWSLAQLAFEQIDRGELAILMRAPATIEEVLDFIRGRIWQPAHLDRAAIAVMAKSLRGALRRADGTWLTLYVDDVQDRAFAERLARARWHEHGVRIVISAQPRITEAIRSVRQDLQIIEIGNFRSAELRRFLTVHGRATALETMPDDVFELLLKPVHASIFVQLPKRDAWAGVSEYQLFNAYWDYASLDAREQFDHPSDRYCLRSLAGQLLTGQSHYPWRIGELRAAGLDDPAILRLEQVGLLRRVVADRVAFAADRMLNWAAAEFLVDTILQDGLAPTEAEARFASIDVLRTKSGEAIGTRLSYVYFDALWLLAGLSEPEFVAMLVREHVARTPPEVHAEDQWTNGFGSLGPRILPALEYLAAHELDGHGISEILRDLPFALAAIAVADARPVEDLIERQITSGVEHRVDIGLRAASVVPAPRALDSIWGEHLARTATYDQAATTSDVEARSLAIIRRELSSDALSIAVAVAPGWLDKKLAAETDVTAIDQLLWRLKDEKSVDGDTASAIWNRHRDRLVALVPSSSAALIEAIGHFRETSLSTVLDAAATDTQEWMPERILRSRARLAPGDAMRQLAEGSDLYGWKASNWWFDLLAAADPKGLANAIRMRASRSDDPPTELIFYYRNRPEAMNAETLDEVLDAFTERLRVFNGTGDPNREEGRLHHPLDFLPRLCEPWQFDRLRSRAGTALEAELLTFAARRRGRIDMTRDITGGHCERILAMIAGVGFDDLVVAELARPSTFGRQDGYVAARWSEAHAVVRSLSEAPGDPDAQSVGQVLHMEALAVHGCDSHIESMIRSGSPIYLNAAEMRSSNGRDTSALRLRIMGLLTTGDAQSLDTAAALTSFLRAAENASRLVATFLEPGTSRQIRLRILASFRALGFYTPGLLPLAREMIAGQIHQEAHLVATYLGEHGDEDARRAVIDWLSEQDIGSSSWSRQGYLRPLIDHPEGRAAVVSFLRRSRTNGHMIVDGGLLRLLAEAGDSRARDELLRAAYRHSGFDRGNAIAAIRYLRNEDPEEAYFAAQRLLTRHKVPAAADLMLEIDPDRAGPELLNRYPDAKPSLRLQLERRLRVHLGGDRLAALLAPLASSQRSKDQVLAAQVAAVIPSAVMVPWLDQLAAETLPAVSDAARVALRQRRLETAALLHRGRLLDSPKPIQWARLVKIMEIVDPYYLWARNDPVSLKDVFEALPYEFVVEARQLRSRLLKDRENAASRADKDR
ncbi:hypothetical protein EH240_21800 [Mesorhizobium tamadayense]|uniref:Uncharacterized protein n=1 Tax=Mesorhizobium tamadayense TaxID=425306 RepID=A0A3P3FFL4_9HYPH|nr:hypothetical protein [Mesorhizobium tamadayense]RRH96922.1 hypothetical protein EH240_21800 [Mesorhizobium tamadayense]